MPVTCKIRVFPELEKTLAYARMLEQAGCSVLAVHGRTREQKQAKAVRADWNIIKVVLMILTLIQNVELLPSALHHPRKAVCSWHTLLLLGCCLVTISAQFHCLGISADEGMASTDTAGASFVWGQTIFTTEMLKLNHEA